jgi:hypothetical protein
MIYFKNSLFFFLKTKMITANNATMVLFLCIFSVIVYRASSVKLVEGWTNVAMVGVPESIDPSTGNADNSILQSQYDAINSAAITPTKLTRPGKTELYTPVYQVPGTMQSNLSPRQSSSGLSSSIRYSVPSEQNMALRANDPMMLARVVQPVESYEHGEKKKQAASTTVATNALPVTGMANSIGGEENVVNYDRYIYAIAKDRRQSQGCPIRGDLNVVGQQPGSNTWFVPSCNPATTLRTGAINVIAGNQNETARLTADLSMVGSLKNTFNGVANVAPLGSPISNLQLATEQAMRDTNMGNSIQQVVSPTSPYDSVISTTSFN